MSDAVDPSLRNRNRMMLVTLVAAFLGTFALAGALRYSGWRPEGLRNKGELLEPPGDLRGVVPQRIAGGDYRWQPEQRTWRVLVAPPVGCGAPCDRLAGDLDKVWQLMGKDADRVHVLWVGPPPPRASTIATLQPLSPSAPLLAALPRHASAQIPSQGVPVYVVDPNGFVILRYAPGADPGDLRTDLARLLKLR